MILQNGKPDKQIVQFKYKLVSLDQIMFEVSNILDTTLFRSDNFQSIEL